MSFKVEIDVSGVWLPATHKYFKKKKDASEFEERFNKTNFPLLKHNTRVRKVGKEKIEEGGFFLGFMTVLMWTTCFSFLTFAVI